MANKYDVIIVGTGITGSSSAHWLKKMGADKVLLLGQAIRAGVERYSIKDLDQFDGFVREVDIINRTS